MVLLALLTTAPIPLMTTDPEMTSRARELTRTLQAANGSIQDAIDLSRFAGSVISETESPTAGGQNDDINQAQDISAAFSVIDAGTSTGGVLGVGSGEHLALVERRHRREVEGEWRQAAHDDARRRNDARDLRMTYPGGTRALTGRRPMMFEGWQSPRPCPAP